MIPLILAVSLAAAGPAPTATPYDYLHSEGPTATFPPFLDPGFQRIAKSIDNTNLRLVDAEKLLLDVWCRWEAWPKERHQIIWAEIEGHMTQALGKKGWEEVKREARKMIQKAKKEIAARKKK